MMRSLSCRLHLFQNSDILNSDEIWEAQNADRKAVNY